MFESYENTTLTLSLVSINISLVGEHIDKYTFISNTAFAQHWYHRTQRTIGLCIVSHYPSDS